MKAFSVVKRTIGLRRSADASGGWISRVAGWASLALILAVAVWLCWFAIGSDLKSWNTHKAPSWVGKAPDAAGPGEKVYDVDTHLLHGGLVKAPRLRDTLRWWTGTWVGQVPFYRPLTSMLFWTQWKLWRDYECRYHLVAIVLHLLAVYQFTLLAADLFRRFRVPHVAFATSVTGLAFVTGLNVIPAQALINTEVYSFWKNQPDSLSLLLFCLTLRSYLHRQYAERLSWPAQVAPLVLYILTCLTKEAGVFLPLLLPFLEADNLRGEGAPRRGAVRRLLPLLAALPLFLILRTVFLRHAVGFTYGSNQAWDFRLLSNVFGPVSQEILLHAWYPIALAATAFLAAGLLWRYRRSRRPRGRVALALVAVSGGVYLAGLGAALTYVDSRNVDAIVGVSLLFSPDTVARASSVVVFILAVGIVFARRRRLAAFAYVWVLLALGLTLFSPSVLHRYYLVNAGYALLIGAGAALWLEILLPKVRNLFTAARHSVA